MLPEGLIDLRRSLDAAIERNDLQKLRGGIVAAAEPCIVLYYGGEPSIGELHQQMRRIDPTVPQKLKDANVVELIARWRAMRANPLAGASRFGGLPDLPPAVSWPEHNGKKLPFTAQIDLASLATFDGCPLPRDGWLWLFVNSTETTEHVALVHHAGPREELVRAAPPPPEAMLPHWIGKALHDVVPVVAAELAVSLPGSSDWWDALPVSDDDERERLDDLQSEIDTSGDDGGRSAGAQLLGHMNFPESSPRDAVTQGGRSGDDWMALLQVYGPPSISWTDMGALNVLIRRPDLDRGDFTSIYSGMYSS